MKKITSIILAAILFVCMTATASAASTETALSKIKSVTAETVFQTTVSVLNKSVSISKKLVVSEDEFLVIPSGTTLALKNGADISGNVYLENGGKLTLSGGETKIEGAVVSDGKITVKSKATLRLNGDIYVSPQGALSIANEGNVFVDNLDPDADFVCLGKTDSKLYDIAKNPLAAVLTITDFDNRGYGAGVFTDNIADIIPDPDKYFTGIDVLDGATSIILSLFFDNGACVTAEKLGGNNSDGAKFISICGVDIRAAKIAINNIKS